MKDSLENEMTAEGLFLQKYGNKITGSESWVIRFAEDYATLKTSHLVQQLEEANFKLQDWYDTSKAVLSESCPQDEKHCACVPFLKREVKEVRKQNSILSKTVSDLMSQTLPEMYIKACDDRDEYREQLEKLQEENQILKDIHADLRTAMKLESGQTCLHAWYVAHGKIKNDASLIRQLESDVSNMEMNFGLIEDQLKSSQEENTLLKSQLEKEKDWAKMYEDKFKQCQELVREKDREIERLKQTISIMEDFNQGNN